MLRRILPWLSGLVLLVVLAEGVCRIFFATIVGRSVLFYGTPLERATVSGEGQSPLLRTLQQRQMRGVGDRNNSARLTDNQLGSYAKYHPNQARSTYDVDTGEVYPVSINTRGFRGPEVSDEKPAGVVRIVTLGASSTFGYHARDDMTYPAQLQRALNAACPSRKFEVINLGIPHLTSTQILALFAAEGVRLHPDVVTFYEGFNDANEIGNKVESAAKPRRSGYSSTRWRKRFVRWMRDRFLVAALADALVTNWTQRFSPAQIAAETERIRGILLDNFATLAQMSREEGFTPILASQQARSQLVPREKVRGITFKQEIELVSKELTERESVDRKGAALLVHAALLEAEAEWARQHGVPFADVLQALDPRRDTLVSWVHLSHEGNQIIAQQLAASILPSMCPDQARPAAASTALAHPPSE